MTSRKISMVPLVVFAVLLGCQTLEIEQTDYFPLAEGNTWLYAVEDMQTSTEYSIICRMIEPEPGIYTWESRIVDENPLMAADADEATEPFDSNAVVVDSALTDSVLCLSSTGWQIPKTSNVLERLPRHAVNTYAGTFHDCILIEGKKNAEGTKFDVWLAPDVGPVYISQWSRDNLFKELRLKEFSPATQ